VFPNLLSRREETAAMRNNGDIPVTVKNINVRVYRGNTNDTVFETIRKTQEFAEAKHHAAWPLADGQTLKQSAATGLEVVLTVLRTR
jgi:hypothetical protein